MKEPFISVVIPCFDELANLQKGVLDHIVHFFEKNSYSYEVIIVDDGSRDGSEAFIERFRRENTQIKLIENDHLGKAGTVTLGMLQARGNYILFTDMDQATPIEEMEKLLPYFDKGYDVVIGSRDKIRKGAPLSRLLISRSSMILRKAIVGLPDIADTQCGFKMFHHTSAQAIFSRIHTLHNGFRKISQSSVTAGFDVELLLIAEKMNLKIKEVPVEWLYVETRRVNPIRDSIEGFRELLAIRLNQLKNTY